MVTLFVMRRGLRIIDRGVVTLACDTNGNVNKVTNQRNYSTNYSNDALGRVTGRPVQKWLSA